MDPAQEFDSNTDLIQRLVQAVPGLNNVDSALWAFLWLANPENLHALLKQAETSRSSNVLLQLTGSNFLKTIKAWASSRDNDLENTAQSASANNAAFKPLEVVDDGKILRVQFYSFPQVQFNPFTPTTQRPDLPKELRSGPQETKLWNCLTEAKICSGDIIELKTDDPALRPLPSFHLLEMQWFLHRVLALSGAAETSADDLDHEPESDEEELPWAELDEEEELFSVSVPCEGENVHTRQAKGSQAQAERDPLAL